MFGPHPNRRSASLAVVSAAILMLAFPLHAAQEGGEHNVPAIDGEAGPCSVEFMVSDATGHPVYGARIKVHIDYGLFGLRQLDLELATNTRGKARFEGLPETTDGVLFFQAMKGRLKGYAVFYPNEECHGRHAIILGDSSWRSSYDGRRPHTPGAQGQMGGDDSIAATAPHEPEVWRDQPDQALKERFDLTGADLYRINCRSCQGSNGQGAPPEIHSLIGPAQGASSVLIQHRIEGRGAPDCSSYRLSLPYWQVLGRSRSLSMLGCAPMAGRLP